MNTKLFRCCGLALLLSLLLVSPLWAAKVQDPASPTILLTGSNRGVGLALVQEYAAQGWNVIATCRTPKKATELKALAAANPKMLIEQLDVTDTRPDRQARGQVSRCTRSTCCSTTPHGSARRSRSSSSATLDQKLFHEVMDTNVYGPLKLSEALVANIEASGQKKIIGMTSGLGSLTLMGRMSRFYYYQMSKAAMNMGMRAHAQRPAGRGITVALAGARHGRYRVARRLRLLGRSP